MHATIDHLGAIVKILLHTKCVDIGAKDIEGITKYCKENNVDYVDYAKALCDSIKSGETNYGILICGTGIGMSIAANKVEGIICAKVNTPREAKLCKEHNMANVMSLAEYTENLEEILYQR